MSTIGLVAGDTLSQWLLALCIISNIQVAGDLEIDSICMGVDRLDQLLHAGSLLLVCRISLTLDEGWSCQIRDLSWIS